MLVCESCGARFKLTIKRNAPEAVPCARCGATIPVPKTGLRTITHGQIFGGSAEIVEPEPEVVEPEPEVVEPEPEVVEPEPEVVEPEPEVVEPEPEVVEPEPEVVEPEPEVVEPEPEVVEPEPEVVEPEPEVVEPEPEVVESESEGDANSHELERQTRWFRLVATLTFLVVIGGIYLVLQQQPETILQIVEREAPPTEAIHLAVVTSNTARGITEAASKLRSLSEEELAAAARGHIERKNFGAAWELIGELRARSPEEPTYARLELSALLGAQEYHDARMAALRSLTHFQDKEFKALFQQAVRLDPKLRPEVVDIPGTLDMDAIRPLGGGRSVSLKFMKNGENVYAFKPAQTEWGDGWRAEVASWRYCEITACEFVVPYSQAARIRRSDFDRLYAMQTERQKTYAERFGELTWIVEDGPDGPEEVLYGVLKVWVPRMVEFPVEFVDIWAPWLHVDGDPAILQAPLRENVQGLQSFRNGEVLRNILREHDGSPTSRIARQLSNIFVFDFLTNNWDRYSEREEYFGVNNHFADGRFISLDNGAAFHTQSSIRVDTRFDPVQRFSRSMVTSVRNLDPSWADAILFPDIGLEGTEKRRLNVFWERRKELLNRIDKLRDEHGDSKILYFP